MDYRTDNNSGIIITKWVDNSTMQLTSNFVGIEPIGEIERWSKEDKIRKKVPCPQIVISYNQSIGGVDLADMLISLYRIPIKTHRWYIKVFWHLIDIAKVNFMNAQIAEEQAVQDVTNSTQRDYLDLVSAQTSYQTAQENFEALNQTFEFIKKRFEAGNTDFYTYLESLNNKNRAEAQLINAKYTIILRKRILDLYRGQGSEN